MTASLFGSGAAPIEVDERLLLDPEGRIKQLSQIGGSVSVNNDVPILRYLRSGPQMEKMAKSYFAEGELEQAFILYNKFATLYIEKLPKHPDYSKAPATEKTRVKTLVKSSFDQALLCKKRLKEKYTQEKELYIQRRESERAIEERKATEEREKREERERIIREQEERKRREEIEERAKLEAYLAETPTQEKKLFLTTPTSLPEPHPQPSEPCPQTTEAPPTIQIEGEEGRADDDDDEGCVPYDDMLLLSNNQPYYDDDEEDMETGGGVPTSTGGGGPIDGGVRGVVPTSTGREESDHVSLTATDAKLSKVLPSIVPQVIERSQLEQTQNCQAPPPNSYQAPPPNSYQAPPPSSYQAPPPNNYQTHPAGYQAPPASYQGVYQAPPPNQIPYQAPPPNQIPYQAPPSYSPYPYGPVPYQQAPPTYPPTSYGGQPSGYYHPPVRPPQAPPTHVPPTRPYTAPPINRDSKPSEESNSQVITSLGGLDGTRPVLVPSDTVSRFKTVASSNTRRNIETCGILAGKLSKNTLKISHIIIPKQTGKADSCETMNEEELFDALDKHDLITVGWIHTHPSQTAFMSSVDLHTHYSYQIMLQEAIAIVVAPKYDQVGNFILTQPHGLNYIGKCSGKGFHTHPKEPPLYEESKHIKYVNTSNIQLIDLR